MKEIVVISGKGGTGKTSITSAFASIAEKFVLCDADVDAPDLHLILKPEIKHQEDFSGGSQAEINSDLCIQCGKCIEVCKFDAVTDNFKIDEFSCEGCGVCVDNCPESAISFDPKVCGQWFISDTRFSTLVHAALGIAEENSGKLVSLIKGQARKIAEEKNLDLILTDGSPGVGCPVIASISGATGIVIISEPTVSGLHDMERVAELAAHFKIPAFLCVNKYDLNITKTELIEKTAMDKGIKVLGRIPFNKTFIDSVTKGISVFENNINGDEVVKDSIKSIWKKLMDLTEDRKEDNTPQGFQIQSAIN